MNRLIVCTRFFRAGRVIRLSRAGVTMRASDGAVYTYVLDNLDPNLSLLMMSDHTPFSMSRVFHVFVGAFLEQFGAADYEVFRFHGDIWPVNIDVEDVPYRYGELICEDQRGGEVFRHSMERLSGNPLTDPMHVSCSLLGDTRVPRVPRDLVPDRLVYQAKNPFLPHPGMFREDDAIGPNEELVRLIREPQPMRVM